MPFAAARGVGALTGRKGRQAGLWRQGSCQDAIHLRGLEFFAYHGVLAEEKALGQRFIIDLDLFLSLARAGVSDCVEDTVNYAEVYAAVRDCVLNKPANLLEHLAEQIASAVLEGFDCQAVRVEVHKPQAPIPAVFADVSVEIWRERE